ncbi:MAG: hypothetical protein GY856_16075 [bacterium]|nr:hypothetical protein [bacterium]
MKHEFTNGTPVTIDPGNPSIISSPIEVSGIGGRIRDVNVTVDVDHTWTEELELFLVGPSGQRVLLVGREGGDGDHFKETVFDDAAPSTIAGAAPPFRGIFRPEESLAAFNHLDPNGTWTLHVEDLSFRDGGFLNFWSLSLESDHFVYRNVTPVAIDPGPPSTVSSALEVRGLGGLVVADVEVALDIDHTWNADLTITLIGPDGTRVVLAEREGGSQDHFRGTVFADRAETSITDASAPFRGRFRPEGELADFADKPAEGRWILEIHDQATHDGGALKHWSLAITAKNAVVPVEPISEFSIEIRFLGGLNANQKAAFERAAARWSEVIIADLPRVRLVSGEIVDDVLIEARGVYIDGRGNILGQAGPRELRPRTFLPARGVMSFDVADLARMEAEGSLVDLIFHEMAHVLGFGVLWGRLGLLRGAGSSNPTFTGENAMREYAALTGAGEPTPVPVANTGGAGTRDAHWRESVLGNELMTGYLDSGVVNPVSRLTIASIEDLGYEVNLEAADAFVLPNALSLAAMGIGAARADHGGYGMVFYPDQLVLPDSAIVND